MSRAFVKEDIDIPERTTRRRSASGLPPGTQNLMTLRGAQQLRSRLAELSQSEHAQNAAMHLRQILESATVVDPQMASEAIVFGSTVTLHNAAGDTLRYRISGVDEVDLEPGNVSWVSPLGKRLLEAHLGKDLHLTKNDRILWRVVLVE